ncbi:hypothetical protein HID58_093161 [Brassica napus]|uniref:Uncharacterized protein n=1 Tax=Brassica napus TaxID=3708 RepID=A0ABQ7XEQ1_BRANA|nr:hypothetical protein HID58_091593 [Brassica napus]KAH0850959.1 hypothetical protein HID58_091159 [Brassica napus]KAH0852145.1 hypothetical protein HID58_094180 [Brassica napus]KAH0852759.1 hypothetical protein HID58_093730 [Brassica napus]KAH0853470.1 hypothetical protein HID58_093161 [Brassica napus]
MTLSEKGLTGTHGSGGGSSTLDKATQCASASAGSAESISRTTSPRWSQTVSQLKIVGRAFPEIP